MAGTNVGCEIRDFWYLDDMPTRNVDLPEHYDHFIDTGIASGRFSSANEVVRQGLKLLEEREKEDNAKLAWLRRATQDAIDSIERGEGMEFETMDDLAAYVNQIGEEVSADIDAKRKHG